MVPARSRNAVKISKTPSSTSHHPASTASSTMLCTGETISTIPATTPTTPKKIIQPRPGRVPTVIAAASSVKPRNTQPMPIHRPSSTTDCSAPRKQSSPSSTDRVPLANISTLVPPLKRWLNASANCRIPLISR